MKLLLTSAGLSNKSIGNSLLELTERPFSELNIAFIPTASNVEKGDKFWVIDDLINLKNLGFKQVDIIDISALPKDVWLPRLEETDIFYFEGGNTFHLMHWIEKSGLKDLLPKMLKTKVYIGVSAGSMVVCKNLDLSTSERLYDEKVDEGAKDEGLGYVDFLIRPHLNSPYFPKLNLENMEKMSQEFPDTFYAIDDQTAIKIVDGKMEIVSEGVWKKFN
ncbi:MAG: Peptidase S51 dipeptidase E [Candidatus Moranbacteria bacterium GW2011_GWC2_37_73]|nr:MAG: Peptidase S51 dipeptidase E [Parcubacteria group bacterium GW2011_GWC1_36_108]KKQ00701.1 MAG: Peptidase S51 dipeptidase E [Candidatus Moranbacteria bacterium GW2011_GWD1_36_198]KKQ01490.1 MAG: Peptidase S51 dipeptidase E [Candidatus Moranbacteria bacterium GW2011_GWD2_36_198]KKQ40422.1 MAG: Peptidase S51 dipeptidase E [Candidatus Moranbacteria bacterium GW2011_GWC2_37_73]HBU11050.1 peptidase S51 [Candidatus Moranbacteria bacterium]